MTVRRRLLNLVIVVFLVSLIAPVMTQTSAQEDATPAATSEPLPQNGDAVAPDPTAEPPMGPAHAPENSQHHAERQITTSSTDPIVKFQATTSDEMSAEGVQVVIQSSGQGPIITLFLDATNAASTSIPFGSYTAVVSDPNEIYAGVIRSFTFTNDGQVISLSLETYASHGSARFVATTSDGRPATGIEVKVESEEFTHTYPARTFGEDNTATVVRLPYGLYRYTIASTGTYNGATNIFVVDEKIETVRVTLTALPSETETPFPSETATVTPAPSETATVTPEPSVTATVTVIPEPSETATTTPVPSETATVIPEPSETVTVSPEPDVTPVETVTPEPSQTATVTPEPSETAIATVTATTTVTPVETTTPQPSVTPVETVTPIPSETPTQPVTPEPSETATAAPEPSETPVATMTPEPTEAAPMQTQFTLCANDACAAPHNTGADGFTVSWTVTADTGAMIDAASLASVGSVGRPISLAALQQTTLDSYTITATIQNGVATGLSQPMPIGFYRVCLNPLLVGPDGSTIVLADVPTCDAVELTMEGTLPGETGEESEFIPFSIVIVGVPQIIPPLDPDDPPLSTDELVEQLVAVLIEILEEILVESVAS